VREEVLSCAIITTAANGVVRPVHERMPVVLPPAAYDRWLGPGPRDLAELGALLVPYPAEEMTATPVSPRVNNPRCDDPACVEPLTPAAPR
jgi:putative SOS response-associated peptidase YedK